MTIVRIFLLLLTPFMQGCISISVYGHSGGQVIDSTHKADDVVAAYASPDGDVIVELSGRRSGSAETARFALNFPRELVENQMATSRTACVTERACAELARVGVSKLGSYEANLIETPPVRPDGSRSLQVTRISNLEQIPRQASSIMDARIYAVRVANDQFGEKNGRIHIAYIEPYDDGIVFHWWIEPGSAIRKAPTLKWLPLTIPADIVTLPLQAVWGVLAVLAMAGAGS